MKKGIVVISHCLAITICVTLTVYQFMYLNSKLIHISIDDVIQIFNDLTLNQDEYKSIFENETLNFLKKCHEKYGAEFSLYCFYNFDNVNLSECTEKFRDEFESNSNWLKFGFHAFDSKADYSTLEKSEAKRQYDLMVEELKRIVRS